MLNSLAISKMIDDDYIMNINNLLQFIKSQYNKELSGSYLIWQTLLSSIPEENKFI